MVKGSTLLIGQIKSDMNLPLRPSGPRYPAGPSGPGGPVMPHSPFRPGKPGLPGFPFHRTSLLQKKFYPLLYYIILIYNTYSIIFSTLSIIETHI